MGNLPSLGAIQRTNAILGALAASALYWRSPAAGASCLLGVVVVIGNLYLLAWLGHFVLMSAVRGGGAWGVIALPLKLLLIAGLIYLLFYRTGIDALGFGAGVATQLGAVLIETMRCAAGRDGAAGAE